MEGEAGQMSEQEEFEFRLRLEREQGAPKQKPAAVTAGEVLRDVPRQVGLTARYGLEGLTQFADTLASPIRVGLNLAGLNLQPFSTTVGQAFDKAGIAPRDANERVIGDATRTLAGGLGLAGAANKAANVVTGVTKNVLGQLGSNLGSQAVGASSAGAAGGAVRESGGGPWEQFLASLAAGVGGGMAANKIGNLVESGARAVRTMMTPKVEQVRAADQQIQLALERSGVDWSQLPDRLRQGLREEVAAAMSSGQPLNADAINRLRVFRATDTTPTVGMLTQNPGQITREMNLAKTGANSTDLPLQRLPNLQNQNTNALLRALDQAGAANAPDTAATGARGIGALEGRVAQARGNINNLYSSARDSAGRSLDLDGAHFTQRANQMLDQEMVGGALPADVANTMNRIARGEMPFTVEIAEQLKTRIGNLQRATSDGGARMALGVVRRALDDTPLRPAPQVNPGNLPAVPGTVPPSPATVGQQSIDAFNAARTANRQYMQTLEANPALAAVDDAVGAVRANPQLRSTADVVGASGFVDKFIAGKGATPGEVRSLLQQVGPEGVQAIRQNIVLRLRNAATNNTDDITKFSNDAYRRALRDIGDEKLAAIFTPEELQHLRDVGDAAKYMQAQPAGSAVNNSNSGALVIGKGLDMLERAAGYVPLGGRDILKGWIQGAQQTQVLTPRNALMLPLAPKQAPSNALAQLLSAPFAAPVQPSQDNRRR